MRLNWEIADGLLPLPGPDQDRDFIAHAQLGAAQMPAGQIKNDEYFGKQEIYHHELSARVPVARAGADPLDLPLRSPTRDAPKPGCAIRRSPRT